MHIGIVHLEGGVAGLVPLPPLSLPPAQFLWAQKQKHRNSCAGSVCPIWPQNQLKKMRIKKSCLKWHKLLQAVHFVFYTHKKTARAQSVPGDPWLDVNRRQQKDSLPSLSAACTPFRCTPVGVLHCRKSGFLQEMRNLSLGLRMESVLYFCFLSGEHNAFHFLFHYTEDFIHCYLSRFCFSIVVMRLK